MKKTLLVIIAMFIMDITFAQGVNFREISYQEALKAAKSEGKNVFMDCYTSWCGPCKDMTKYIFPQENVGTFMNERFVSVKFDMEKGEGVELKKQFNVTSFPTFLIINLEGKVLHKFVGSRDANEFLKEFDYDPKQAWGDIQTRYENGDRTPLFLKQYLQMLVKVSDKSAPRVASELFTVLNDEEKQAEEYRFLYTDLGLYTVGSDIYNYFLDHREIFNTLLGKEEVDELLKECNKNFLNFASFGEKEFTPEECVSIESNLEKTGLTELLPFWNVVQACRSKDNNRIIKACKQNFPQMNTHLCGSYYSLFLAHIQKDGTKSQQKACAKILEDIKVRSAKEQKELQEKLQQRMKATLE